MKTLLTVKKPNSFNSYQIVATKKEVLDIVIFFKIFKIFFFKIRISICLLY